MSYPWQRPLGAWKPVLLQGKTSLWGLKPTLVLTKSRRIRVQEFCAIGPASAEHPKLS